MKKILSVILVIFMLAATFTAMAVPASAASTIDTYDFDFESDTLDGVAGTFAQGWYFRSGFDSSVGHDANNTNRYLKLTGTSNYLQTYLSYAGGETNVYNPGDQFVFSYDIRISSDNGTAAYELRLFNPRLKTNSTDSKPLERQIFTIRTDGKGKGTMKVDSGNVCLDSDKDGNGTVIDFAYGVWHNIAVSVNATTYKLYIDGENIASATIKSDLIKTGANKFTIVTLGVNDSVNKKELHYDNIKYSKGLTEPVAPTHLPIMNSVNGIGFVGTQFGTLVSNADSVRLVGIIGNELGAYESVGFKVECNGKSMNTNITKAYLSILADGKSVAASEYKGMYFFTFVIKSVPSNTTFKITPFAQLEGGDIVYSSVSYTVTIE